MVEKFAGHGRFEILREIGRGGMGIVHEAFDHALGSRVALKTLKTIDASGLYRFKQEFRALGELVHPNLIPLYELFSEGEQWYFTMELVEGVDFLTYVHTESNGGDPSAVPTVVVGPGGITDADRFAATTTAAVDPRGMKLGPPSTAMQGAESTVAAGPGGPVPSLATTRATMNLQATTQADGRKAKPTFDPSTATDSALREESLCQSTHFLSAGPPVEARTASPPKPLKTPNFERLRSTLVQLAEGVHALHRAGKLHRDIKPSNILVRPDGRVVLLDFGLILEIEDSQLLPSGAALISQDGPPSSPGYSATEHATEAGIVVGTVAYMAPEQAAGRPLSEACDWYAVGVVLYKALTGTVPFTGTNREILRAKQMNDLTPPVEIAPDIPDDLNDLCLDLLNRDPESRPLGEEVLARLGARPGVGGRSAPEAGAADTLPFIGRDSDLQTLRDCYAEMLYGKGVTVLIRGRSGMGKSALIRHFLDRLTSSRRVIVLSGRCYEQETVPYNGLDSLVDALSRVLLRLPEPEAERLLPRSIAGLARLFPVLLRVEAVARAVERAQEVPEPQELRRHAFAALRELLTKLARRQPLVLVLDDLQWGDQDCAALLLDLLRPPHPPQFLLLAAYRSEYDASSTCLRAIRDAVENPHPSQLWKELPIEPLEHADARALALRLLGGSGPAAEARAERIAQESGGYPYFLAELARPVDALESPTTNGTDDRAVDLEDLLWRRYLKLPPESRQLLEVVAVARRPIRLRHVCESTGMGALGLQSVVGLRSARLLRRSGPGVDDEVDTFHDRIREAIVSRIPAPLLRTHHERLAFVLGKDPETDFETLAVHYVGAERFAEAGEAYGQAAEMAEAALAFDRAAKLYRLSLQYRPLVGEEEARIRVRLAEALANAGRGGEAAREFQKAASGLPPSEALDLERRAAYQFCTSGRIEEGLATMQRVMRRVGLRLPRTPSQALLSLLLGRLRLKGRGLKPRKTRSRPPSAAEIARIDITWSASTGLTVVDTIRAADLQTWNLLRALDVGEPTRVARALAWEAAHAGVAGERSRARVEMLLQSAREIALREANPYLDALILLASGTSACFRGEFAACRDFMNQAECTFRASCTGVAWELGTAQTFKVWSLFWLGELEELTRLVPILAQEARERDDLYLETNLRGYGAILARLTRDESAAALAALQDVMKKWTRTTYHSQHFIALAGMVHAHLYDGDHDAALGAMADTEARMKRAGLMRVQNIRRLYYYLRAHAAVGASDGSADRDRLLQDAARDADNLLREKTRQIGAFGTLIHAAVAHRRGEPVTPMLEEVAREFDAHGMKIFAAATRHRLGTILGGERGRALIAAGVAAAAAQKVVDPERMLDLHVPRFPGDVGRGPPL